MEVCWEHYCFSVPCRTKGGAVITRWGDAEEEALQGLPHLAQLLYLRCLRRYMDYDTGLVGVKRRVSYQMFREVLYVDEVPGRRIKDREITVQVLRSALDQLVRVGLVECRSRDRQLIFFLPLALLQDTPAKNQNNRAATEEQQSSSNRGNTNTGKEYGRQDNRAATDPRGVSNNNPPGSGISNTYTHTARARAKEFLGVADLVRQGISEPMAREWLAYRENRGAVLTQSVVDALVEEAMLARISADEAIGAMIRANWSEFDHEWYRNRQQRQREPKHEACREVDRSATGKVVSAIRRRDGIAVCARNQGEAGEIIEGDYYPEAH